MIVGAMRELSGVTPWQGTLHAMNLIGSHDTHRVMSLLGDPKLVDVAFGMLAAYPGVPMIYYGDEIGLATMGPEYARIPMPWAHPERWDQRRLANTRALFGARARSVALRRGGLRWLCIDDDALAFLREAPGETVLVHAARANHPPIRIPAAGRGRGTRGARRDRRPAGRRRRRDHASRRWAGVRDVATVRRLSIATCRCSENGPVSVPSRWAIIKHCKVRVPRIINWNSDLATRNVEHKRLRFPPSQLVRHESTRTRSAPFVSIF